MNRDLVATLAPDGFAMITDDSFTFDSPPDWLHKPTSKDLLVVWPKAAWAKKMGGRTSINCIVNPQGALLDCVPLFETPPHENFGAAAIALTPQFLMKPAMLKGGPTLSVVNIPINFPVPPGGQAWPPADPGRITAPAAMAWLAAPTYAEMIAAYPKKAREAQLAGHATIDCGFTQAGSLIDCTTISEQPKGEGFGAAAHNLAKRFRAPATLGGKALKGANVQVPFTFDPAALTDDKPAIGKPQWAALPSAEETAAAFEAVSKSGVDGTVRVMLHCTVQPGGGVSDCSVAREDPAGAGVGQAALSLAPHFKITTWTIEGLPTVGGTVNIPLRYEGGAKDAAPPAKP